MESLIVDNIWVGLPLWIIIYLADYYMTIHTAKLYKANGQKHITYEGSIELTPQFQDDVDNLRSFSPKFFKALVFSSLALAFIFFAGNRYGEPFSLMFSCVLGALVLRGLVVIARHIHNITFYSKKNIVGLSGTLDHKRWLIYKISSVDLLASSALLLFLAIIAESIFIAGGALSCLVVGLEHRAYSKQLLKTGKIEVWQKPRKRQRIMLAVMLIVFGLYFYQQHSIYDQVVGDEIQSYPALLEGCWADPYCRSEDGNSFVYEFTSDGKIIEHHYKENTDAENTVEVDEIGWWKIDHKLVWIKYTEWEYPESYYFTEDNVLISPDDINDVTWKMTPVNLKDNDGAY